MEKPETPTRGWVVGRVFGARIVLHPTTLVLVALIAFLITSGDRGQTTGSSLARGLIFAALLIGFILVHEGGHAVAARAFGWEVKEIVVTLVGGHTAFDAKSITPMASGITAAAGPLANLLLGLAALPLLGLSWSPNAELIVRSVVVVNLVLAVFNALPGTPLDGGRVLEAVVWRMTGKRTSGMKAAAWGGRVIAVAYLAYVLTTTFGSGEQPDFVVLVWAFLIFSILWPAAGASLRAANVLERVEGMSVAMVMRGAVGVPFDTPLAVALDRCRTAECDEVVVLSADGRPAGHFSLGAAASVPQERLDSTGLGAVTIPLPEGAAVAPDLDGFGLLGQAREWWGKADALAVVDEGEVVGVVRLAELSERFGSPSPRP